MEPDRLDQVSGLYHAALQRPLEDRGAFLAEACAGDESLREEVESLLRYGSASARFLETPAAGLAGALAGDPGEATTTGQTSPDVSPSVHRLVPGTMVGRYRIEALLGVGGMGEVYRAHDTRLGRTIALKALPAHLRANPQRRMRFEREARSVARLRHPHICTLHDVGSHGNLDFLVMEYIEGESLGAKLRSGVLSVEDTLRLASEVASALGAAHAKGLIHRDIKPSNVMVTPDGHAIVVDFGLARVASGFETGEANEKSGLSQSGDFVGTPHYMSPEQVLGQPLDPRTDIFSLGVVMFECLTGRLPFDGDTRYQYLQNLLSTGPRSLTEFRSETPAEAQQLVAACLERDVSKRIDSASWLSVALTRVASGASAGEVPLRRRESTRRSGLQRRLSRLVAAAGVESALGRWAMAATAVVAAIALAISVTRWAGSTPTVIEPVVLAILPAANPTDDPIAEQIGTAITSLVSRNLGKVSGLKVVSRELTAPYGSARTELAPLQRDAGVSDVLDLTVRQTAPTIDVLARLRRPGVDAPTWERTLTGDIVEIQASLLAKLRDGFAKGSIRAVQTSELAAISELPTAQADALMAYIEARALLDRPEEFGNVQRATDLLEGAIGIDARFALAHAGLADALRARFTAERNADLMKRATAAATTAVQLDSDASAAHTAFAAVQNESGKRDAAVKSLHHALDLQPDNDDAHRLLGEILAAQGQVDAGVAEVRAAVRLRPSFTNYYRLGAVLFKASRYTAALEAYGRAVELRPSHGGAFEMLGATNQMLGHHDQAIGNYEHAIRVGPTATAYTNLGTEYFRTGAYEKARIAYLSAITRNPKKASLYRDLGDVYLRLNRRTEARAEYQKAIALSQDALAVNASDAFSVVLIAICEANLGQRTKAERHGAEALALMPSNRDILYRVAKVYALTGNRPAALKALRGAIERGYHRDEARRDPELASIKSLPEFETLLSEEVRR